MAAMVIESFHASDPRSIDTPGAATRRADVGVQAVRRVKAAAWPGCGRRRCTTVLALGWALALAAFVPGMAPTAHAAGSIYVEIANEDKGALRGTSELAFGRDDSDGNFSHGFFVAYSWARSAREQVSVSFEQHVFTPSGENKRSDTAVAGDRPAAAFLGGGVAYVLDAEGWVQAISAWEDQVADRTAVIAAYRPALRWLSGCRPMCVELAPHAALVQGNVLAYEGLGTTLRVGNRLDRDFGPPEFSPLSRGPYHSDYRGLSWSVFAGVERRQMRRNYLLEGPASVSGLRTVSMLLHTGDRQFGTDVRYARATASLVFVRRAAEFNGQAPQQFVRVGLGMSY
jgi:lipid A 3-O-deacylase